jgi:hypothetical protein
MAVIRSDKYGLFIKNGGYIARPVPTEYTRHAHEITSGSKYSIGDRVKARHYGGSGLHDVGDELWSSHGCYFDMDGGKDKNSTTCWEPVK